MARYLPDHGRGVFGEIMRMRGLPVRRFPRWECLPMRDEQKQELRKGLIEAGVSPALP
jgi:hypothetical protein